MKLCYSYIISEDFLEISEHVKLYRDHSLIVNVRDDHAWAMLITNQVLYRATSSVR